MVIVRRSNIANQQFDRGVQAPGQDRGLFDGGLSSPRRRIDDHQNVADATHAFLHGKIQMHDRPAAILVPASRFANKDLRVPEPGPLRIINPRHVRGWAELGWAELS
jgi:hypothetical protein